MQQGVRLRRGYGFVIKVVLIGKITSIEKVRKVASLVIAKTKYPPGSPPIIHPVKFGCGRQ
jgi:hypothetical protein